MDAYLCPYPFQLFSSFADPRLSLFLFAAMDVIPCDSSSELEMPAARIRGGLQQRKRRRVAHKASEAASVAQPPLSSKTALFLASKWAWGEYSPQEVQRIAALVTADILTAIESSSGFSDLDALAQLGSKGRFPEKMSSGACRIPIE